jgi:hypothetical protein
VVVVAPATAVAGAATTTEAQYGHALNARRICRRAEIPADIVEGPTVLTGDQLAERYGADPGDAAMADAAALGITVCAASGDNGSGDAADDGQPHVDFPASSPHALACGGTKLLTDGPGQPRRHRAAEPAPGLAGASSRWGARR